MAPLRQGRDCALANGLLAPWWNAPGPRIRRRRREVIQVESFASLVSRLRMIAAATLRVFAAPMD
jgi:hypothetical protein